MPVAGLVAFMFSSSNVIVRAIAIILGVIAVVVAVVSFGRYIENGDWGDD